MTDFMNVIPAQAGIYVKMYYNNIKSSILEMPYFSQLENYEEYR